MARIAGPCGLRKHRPRGENDDGAHQAHAARQVRHWHPLTPFRSDALKHPLAAVNQAMTDRSDRIACDEFMLTGCAGVLLIQVKPPLAQV
jgi:hypothetical protein